MGKSFGSGGLVYIGTDLVGELESWNYNEESAQVVEDFAIGDTAVSTAVSPAIKGSGDFRVFHDPSDAGQAAAIPTGTAVTLKLYNDGETAGKPEWTGTAHITGRGLSMDKGAYNRATHNFIGKLTEGTVSA